MGIIEVKEITGINRVIKLKRIIGANWIIEVKWVSLNKWSNNLGVKSLIEPKKSDLRMK